MEIFLGAELYAGAGWRWSEVRVIAEEKLKQLEDENYGEGLNSIGIISLILPDEFLEDVKKPERIRYLKKEKSADIRLLIDYKKFCRANVEVRYNMYAEHILKSIQSIKKRVGKDVEFERLYKDVENLLIGDGQLHEM